MAWKRSTERTPRIDELLSGGVAQYEIIIGPVAFGIHGLSIKCSQVARCQIRRSCQCLQGPLRGGQLAIDGLHEHTRGADRRLLCARTFTLKRMINKKYCRHDHRQYAGDRQQKKPLPDRKDALHSFHKHSHQTGQSFLVRMHFGSAMRGLGIYFPGMIALTMLPMSGSSRYQRNPAIQFH